jgi:uroporphyrin-III C-methyltransferase / precorrin-2 dehydrogenase / sirohydrochlorin ferrochelatase
MRIFPISLVIEGLDVPVVGRGPLAEAKARGLVRAGARVCMVEPAALLLPPMERPARLALVATDHDPEGWARRLRGEGLLVNVADRPDLCDFLLPAIVDRAPVTLAIATGGASATLARRLREGLEALLPETLGPLARRISALRPAVAQRLQTPVARRAYWDAMLSGPLDPFATESLPDDASLLALADGGAPEPLLSVIHLASGSIGDVTLRAQRRLQAADTVLLAGEGVATVATLARRDAEVKPLDGALPSARAGERIVLLLDQGQSAPADWPGKVEHLWCGKASL